ncbi:MAG: aminomethyl-transferring glycine dehydrogenase subunit GcvPA [Thermomicrobiales bacterium]
MTFNPHTAEDRRAMLDAIGVHSVDELFSPVPTDVRFPQLNLPPALTEMEAASRLQTLATRNRSSSDGDTFLGAGSYCHFVPATVGQILARGEFYTAYTPYQPEVSQGTLQVIYEFQSMVAALYGMDVANASMYDGATALAEGALIPVSASRKRHRIVVAGSVHPSYRDVLRTYTAGLAVDLIELPIPTDGFVTRIDDVLPYLNDDLASLVVQYPNFFGGIEDVVGLGDAAHAVGGALVVCAYPVPLGLLRSPGSLGADVVAGEGQALGVAQSFGGPYVGLLATRQSYVRQMPGRLAGVTTDTEGKRGFVLTLQTREQHIRRDKATSNICTNQGLMATAATVHMSTLGPAGFQEVAERCYQNAHYLALCISSLPGYRTALAAPFFHEFVVQSPETAASVNARLAANGIIGGLDLSTVDAALDHHFLVCATELNGKESIDRFVAALA